MSRVTFATKIGVIAATVGSSVGLGNIWRFPYEAGQNGGAAFFLIYILCILLLGLPVMISEFVVGRSTHANSVKAFKILAPNTHWHYIGYLGMLAALFIMGFYSVIAGWVMEYLYQSISNQISHLDAQSFNTAFTSFTTSTYTPIFWIAIFLFFNYLILIRDVKSGIEKVSNWLMPFFFVLLIVFCVRSFFLSGASEGLSFLFRPDFSKIDSSVVLRAMGQAFFSLSLGMGTLITYSSYFSKSTPLPRTAVNVAFLDTLVAVFAGIIIFPAVFSFGINPSQGPELVFITLPNIFQQMPGAYLWSVLFFILLLVATLTSTISLCEVGVAFLHEQFKIKRHIAAAIFVSACFVLSIGCSLSFGVLKDFKLFDRTIFDSFDFISSNILLPLGGFFTTIFVGWRINRTKLKSELSNQGTLNMWFWDILLFCIKYIAPLAILFIFLSGLNVF